MCKDVLEHICSCNPNWFILPTSTGGKYHGGLLGRQNLVGGIYQHVLALTRLVPRVIDRYSDFGIDLTSTLFACSILHDVARLGFDQSAVFSVSTHGELGADFIASLGYRDSALLYAISNHMYGWRVINIFNQVVGGVNADLLLLAMLCECDYFGSIS
jgi:hypothetical protein